MDDAENAEDSAAGPHGHEPNGSGPEERGNSRQRVLAAALEIVEERGEAALRIGEVVEASGLSVGSIYHFFEDREGLIEAVRVEQFRGQVEEDIAAISSLLDLVQSREDFVDGMCVIARASADASRVDNRWRRISVIGAARRRPHLVAAIANMQGQIRDRLAGLVAVAQQRGFVEPDVDPQVLASFVQAFTLGKILTELGPGTEVDEDGWVDVVRRLAVALTTTD